MYNKEIKNAPSALSSYISMWEHERSVSQNFVSV